MKKEKGKEIRAGSAFLPDRRGLLFARARQKTGSLDIAKDLVQEPFVGAL